MVCIVAACLAAGCAAARNQRFDELFDERARNSAQHEPYRPITADIDWIQPAPPPTEDRTVARWLYVPDSDFTPGQPTEGPDPTKYEETAPSYWIPYR